MKTLNNTILKVEHFATIRGEDITEVKIRIKGHVEEKYLQIEVNELDVESRSRQMIESEIFRLSTLLLITFEPSSIRNKIKGLQLALTYLD
jgi:hypothetical protein